MRFKNFKRYSDYLDSLNLKEQSNSLRLPLITIEDIHLIGDIFNDVIDESDCKITQIECTLIDNSDIFLYSFNLNSSKLDPTYREMISKWCVKVRINVLYIDLNSIVLSKFIDRLIAADESFKVNKFYRRHTRRQPLSDEISI